MNRWFSRPASTRTSRPVVLAAVVLLAAACSGDDDDASTPTTAAPIADTTIVTTTVPSTTTPDVTDPPTTTTPTTPSTTGSEPEPTSDVGDPDVQAVVDAARASWLAYIEAIRDPGDEDRLRELAETKRADALASSISIVQELVASNQRAVPHENIDSVFVLRPNSVDIDDESATIEYCWVGSDVIVEVAGNSDGTDRIVDDDILVFVERETFEMIDGRWRKVSGTVLEQIEGEVSCDDFV